MIIDELDFFEQEEFEQEPVESTGPIEENVDIITKVEDPIENVETPAEEQEEQEEEEEEDLNPRNIDEEIEQEEEEEQGEVKVKIEGNPLVLFAEKWKSEGKLPEDFELTDDLTDEELDLALYNYKSEREKESLREEIIRELTEEQGLNEQVLSTAKKLHFGVTDENIQKEEVYTYLGTVEFDTDSEYYEEDVYKVGVQFYIDKDFSQEYAEKYATRDIEDDPESAISLYQGHFVKKAISQKRENEEIIAKREEVIAEERRKKSEKINGFFEKGELGGRKYTKDQIKFLKDSIYKKDQVYVDPNTGARKRVTLEQKKILESRADFDKYLKARIDFILGYDIKDIEEASTTKAKNKLLKDLGNMIKVETVTNGNNKKPKSQNREEDELLLF